MKKYTLTISILASNRKDTLPKTLESIKPILDNVSSELIVVDTGCDEDLLEIIRKYTDKIEKFTWCNDFSKARNVGIEKAQGDWFMFIDDDEWFEDVTQFVEFFNSTEKDKYNYGKYIVRNYENFEGTAWIDSVVGRMFRLFEGTKFVDAIHERPMNIEGPAKDFTAYAHHYGYVFSDEADKKKHFERNEPLILKQIEEEPWAARHYTHLIQEYNSRGEFEKAVEYAYKGIKNSDSERGHNYLDNKKDVVGLFATVISDFIEKEKFDDVLRQSKEYLESEYINEFGKAILYGYCAAASYRLKLYSDSINYAHDFFKYADYVEKNTEVYNCQRGTSIEAYLMPENRGRIAAMGMAAAICSQDENNMLEFVRLYDFSIRKPLVDPELCMTKLAEYMGQSRRDSVYVELAQSISKQQVYFDMLLNRVKELKSENYNAYLNIAGLLSKTDIRHGYVVYLKIIAMRNAEEPLKLVALYREAVDVSSDILEQEHEFWQIASERGIELGSMIEDKGLGVWMESVDKWITHAKISELVEKSRDLSGVLAPQCMQMRYFDMVLSEAFAYRRRVEGSTKEQLEEELARYSAIVLNFYREIYKANIFEDYATMLPMRCQTSLLIRRLLICENSEEKKNIAEQIARQSPGLEKIMHGIVVIQGDAP